MTRDMLHNLGTRLGASDASTAGAA
jgi:hypothetical protein